MVILTALGGIVLSIADIIGMGRLRDYAWSPSGRRDPTMAVFLMNAQSVLTKIAALVIWFGVASSSLSSGAPPAARVAGVLVALGGTWLALHGQYWLPAQWRKARVRRALRERREVSFTGTVAPLPSALYDLECQIRVGPGSLVVVSDPGLPDAFGVQLTGTASMGSLRRADPHDAPGRPRWWSMPVTHGESAGCAISAEREYVEILSSLGPFGGREASVT